MGLATDDIPWGQLKEKLQYSMRWQPLYNSDIHRKLGELQAVPRPYDKNLTFNFLEKMHEWVNGSRLNHLEGLKSFEFRDFCNGVTQYLDELHFLYKDRLVILNDEYKYHERINPHIHKKEIDELQSGDQLVLSLPFSATGDIHEKIDKVLEICETRHVNLHLDCAWYGCTRGITFDFSHPFIQSAAFSLSKGLGLGKHRAGIRYSRKRPVGPLAVTNDFDYVPDSHLWIGINFIEHFGVDYLQTKYFEIYSLICEKLTLKPTATVFLAYDEERSEYVGLRPLIRWISEGSY